MSEAIRQIQLKRTKKGQQDENISGLVLNYGEPVVNTENGYMGYVDGGYQLFASEADYKDWLED